MIIDYYISLQFILLLATSTTKQTIVMPLGVSPRTPVKGERKEFGKEGEREISGENEDIGGEEGVRAGKGNVGKGGIKGGTRIWEGRRERELSVPPNKNPASYTLTLLYY
jgi:hypothetical protein